MGKRIAPKDKSLCTSIVASGISVGYEHFYFDYACFISQNTWILINRSTVKNNYLKLCIHAEINLSDSVLDAYIYDVNVIRKAKTFTSKLLKTFVRKSTI